MSKRAKEPKRRGRRQISRKYPSGVDDDDSDTQMLTRKDKTDDHAGLEKRDSGEEEEEEDDDDDFPSRTWNQNSTENDKESTALPILTAKGKWKSIRPEMPIVEPGVVDDIITTTDHEEISLTTETDKIPSKSFDEIKKDLCLIALSVTEETECNIGKLKTMLEYTDSSKYSAEVARLALVSILAVYKDILPGYYIRSITEAERGNFMSKETRKLRNFEEAILNSYHRFFRVLKNIIQPTNRKYSQARLPILTIALTCVQELMQFTSHFNLFEDVLKLAAFSLTLPFENEVERTCHGFRRLFEADEHGMATMLAIRLISNMIKDKNYNCPLVWLTAIETVRLRSNMVGRIAKNNFVLPRKKKHMSGREKKEWKAKQEELKKIAETKVVASEEKTNKWNSETLKYLFRVYLGILKHHPKASLLPPVLVGLAKHSHQIGVEYFADLLQSLRRLMEQRDQDELDLISALHCILTVDRIHSINENLAAMDLKFFYNSLFRQLSRLIAAPKLWQWDIIQTPLQQCLSNLFHPKRLLPGTRVAAFVQRLTDLSWVLLQTGLFGHATVMMENVKLILTHHSKAQGILIDEPFGQGIYLPDCDDPDLCNPFSRSLSSILINIKQYGQHGSQLKLLIDEITKLAPKQ